MNKSENLKEQIRTINPELTDELLDLLYEYIMERINEDVQTLPAFKEN